MIDQGDRPRERPKNGVVRAWGAEMIGRAGWPATRAKTCSRSSGPVDEAMITEISATKATL
jgi:hypothetical protein